MTPFTGRDMLESRYMEEKLNRKIFFCGLFSLVFVVILVASCGGGKSTTTTSQSGGSAQTTTTSSLPPGSTSVTTSATATTSLPATTSASQTTTQPTTTTTTTTPPTTTTTTTTTATTTTATATETLGDILSRATGTVKYDMITKMTGQPDQTATYWVKNNKMRYQITVEGQVSITIIDLDTKVLIMWTQGENFAIQMNMSGNEAQPAGEQAQAVTDYNYTIIGTETFDGKECLVVEYSSNGVTTRMWIWKAKGFSVKVVTGGTTIEYRNFDFSDIPDSMFTVPPGVEIMTMPSIPVIP